MVKREALSHLPAHTAGPGPEGTGEAVHLALSAGRCQEGCGTAQYRDRAEAAPARGAAGLTRPHSRCIGSGDGDRLAHEHLEALLLGAPQT